MTGISNKNPTTLFAVGGILLLTHIIHSTFETLINILYRKHFHEPGPWQIAATPRNHSVELAGQLFEDRHVRHDRRARLLNKDIYASGNSQSYQQAKPSHYPQCWECICPSRIQNWFKLGGYDHSDKFIIKYRCSCWLLTLGCKPTQRLHKKVDANQSYIWSGNGGLGKLYS